MRRDFRLALLIGFLAALVWIPVLRSLSGNFRSEMWALFIVLPTASAAGLYVCKILFRRVPFLYPFAKYAIVGFLNVGIDFAIFNLLIYATGIEQGLEIALFKAISFICGMINGYLWNRAWTFEFGVSIGGAKQVWEFFRYTAVTILGLVINVGLTSLIVNLINPQLGLSQLTWDNVAVVAATLGSIIWNFVGYKIVVFRSHDSTAVARN